MISYFVKIFIIVFTFSLLLSFKVLSKPNVLFILIDDMGWMDLGCQGNKNLHTPNIDNLA